MGGMGGIVGTGADGHHGAGCQRSPRGEEREQACNNVSSGFTHGAYLRLWAHIIQALKISNLGALTEVPGDYIGTLKMAACAQALPQNLMRRLERNGGKQACVNMVEV